MADDNTPQPGEAAIVHGAQGPEGFHPFNMIMMAVLAGMPLRAGLGITNMMGAHFDLGEMIGNLLGIKNDGPGLSGHTIAASPTVPKMSAPPGPAAPTH